MHPTAYDGRVKNLVKLLVLLAMLFMPLGMGAAPASAPHQAMMADLPMGHCPDRAPRHGMKGGISECTMACAASLPATDTPVREPRLVTCDPVLPNAAQRLHGLHPETATPPPKSS